MTEMGRWPLERRRAEDVDLRHDQALPALVLLMMQGSRLQVSSSFAHVVVMLCLRTQEPRDAEIPPPQGP